MVSWNRDDVRFFAAGACHILAFAFMEAHPMHAYVTDGAWAFDFDGWTPVGELLAVTCAAEADVGYEQRSIEADLSTFCREHSHRDRPYYAFDPWERALRYITQFPTPEEHRAMLRPAL